MSDITWVDTPADEVQRDTLHALLAAASQPGSGWTIFQPELVDPQWAGPSLPHPTEASSEQEADELREGWDDEVHGIEPNQEASL